MSDTKANPLDDEALADAESAVGAWEVDRTESQLTLGAASWAAPLLREVRRLRAQQERTLLLSSNEECVAAAHLLTSASWWASPEETDRLLGPGRRVSDEELFEAARAYAKTEKS